MTATDAEADVVVSDRFDARIVRSAGGLLRIFNEAGALSAADVHVALRLGCLLGELDERVLLAAAFAVRAPRLGHVCTDLSTVRAGVVVEGDVPVDLGTLPWPSSEDWLVSLGASELVAGDGDDGTGHRPLRRSGSRLYLDRYWREERQVGARPAGSDGDVR